MKIVYLATRGERGIPLSVEREVDMLSRTFVGSFVEFRPLPWARAENLSRDLSDEKIDILHLSAHGEGEHLQIRNEQGATVMMTARHILSFLSRARGHPRLIYLNACDSCSVAKMLAMEVPFAVGSTLPILNDQGLHAALSFYSRILLGDTVQEAYQAARAIVNMLASDRHDVLLFQKRPNSAAKVALLPKPRILAKFVSSLRKEFVEVVLGADNVPPETSQIVFFTDDDAVIDADDTTEPITQGLCMVARGTVTPPNSKLWCDEIESWRISGDFNLYAIGVTKDGRKWTSEATVCEALRLWYGRRHKKEPLRSVITRFENWPS
jgi:hypothetical protein